MTAWHFSLLFASGIAIGLIIHPLARMIESRGIDHFLDAMARVVTAPFTFFKKRLVRNPAAIDTLEPATSSKAESPKVDPREQEIDDVAQTIRGMLLTLAAAIQRTDKVASDSTQMLGDVRSAINQITLPGDLKDVHDLLLAEIDRMITSNSSLKSELNHSQEILASQREQIENLKTAVRIDGLTKLSNRASFDEKLVEMTHLMKRYHDGFSLLMIDVDNFKNINDTYGHPGGDRVLKGIALKIKATLRQTDFIARFGGDEFAGILVKASAKSAAAVARKLCEEIHNSRFILDGHEIRTTLSIGVAEALAGDTEGSILKRADMALYQAKQAGRNGVKVADSPLQDDEEN